MHRSLLDDNRLIRSPHSGDEFLFTSDTVIPLTASHDVSWRINYEPYGLGTELHFTPPHAGTYEITAQDHTRNEQLTISFTDEH
jgi:hypothetical protein